VQVGRSLRRGPPASGLRDQAASDLGTACVQRHAQRARGVIANPFRDRSAIDDRAAVLDVEEAHRSPAIRFSL
jgi:hypothetical protein